jgi:hypothetical protein
VLHAQVPHLINYQGRVAVDGVNFDGSGQFKFALVDADGTTSYWGNDGTSTAGSEPAAAVTLTVTAGQYSVLLGDTALPNMVVIPADVLDHADVFVRIWFNDGTNGSRLLTPDQRIWMDGATPTADAWQVRASMSGNGSGSSPFARSGHTAVWTGSEMIVWGGGNMDDGGRSEVRLQGSGMAAPTSPTLATAKSSAYTNEATAQIAQALSPPDKAAPGKEKLYFEDLDPELRNVLQVQLQKPGDVSAVIEMPGGFLVFLTKERKADTLTAASRTIPKRSYEEWLTPPPAVR